MLYRKYEQEIERYLNTPGQALLLTGARQTGKTFLVREMAGRSGRNFLEFNLIEQPEVVRIFNESRNAKDFLMRLSLIAGMDMTDGSILFFDEIQEAADPVTLIKFLVDEGSYQYVFSGSLLGVELKDIRSVPVGYLHVMEIYPLDFMEFLTAVGAGPRAVETMHGCFRERKPVDSFMHDKFLEFFICT